KVLLTLFLIILSPLLIIVVLLYFLWGAILHLAIWMRGKKQFVIFVYSDSPTWKEYIEKEILPHIQDRAVILNWSERQKWKNSLAVLAFQYFGGHRNFNPIGLVFRPFHLVGIYRFYEAFKEFKYGNPRKVNELQNEFFKRLGIQRTS
ncbi:MAG TPA: hypothetical protein VFY83_02905, partial [Anaerolineales bacterium]|nr:hypothetical protein [Anaerolineales bacterium]